jgi:hypothetical protein
VWDGGESRPYKVIPNSIRYEIEKACRKFIWGRKKAKIKLIHLIKWKFIGLYYDFIGSNFPCLI